MKIGFISYEYPLDTPYGGIATYVQQAARMLAGRGHHVEVFAASPSRSGTVADDGLPVHLIREADRLDFRVAAGHVFARRHEEIHFDVLEGPEYNADAAKAVKLAPEIPLVVKMNTPSYLSAQLSCTYGVRARMADYLRQLRAVAGALRRGRAPAPFRFRPAEMEAAVAYDSVEGRHAWEADLVVAPSVDLCRYATDRWRIAADRVRHLPDLYVPTPDLLEIPIETRTRTVGYFGRLEARKGVLDLAQAVPILLASRPEVKVRFVGAMTDGTWKGQPIAELLQHFLKGCQNSVSFPGKVPLEMFPRELAQVDVAVFPSIWENFPYVCLAAMAAGRGIVASSAGGMSEMLAGGQAGLLVPPQQPRPLASALLRLLDHEEERMALGRQARQRVLTEYNAGRIGALKEQAYQTAMARRSALGPRPDGGGN